MDELCGRTCLAHFFFNSIHHKFAQTQTCILLNSNLFCTFHLHPWDICNFPLCINFHCSKCCSISYQHPIHGRSHPLLHLLQPVHLLASQSLLTMTFVSVLKTTAQTLKLLQAWLSLVGSLHYRHLYWTSGHWHLDELKERRRRKRPFGLVSQGLLVRSFLPSIVLQCPKCSNLLFLNTCIYFYTRARTLFWYSRWWIWYWFDHMVKLCKQSIGIYDFVSLY